MVGDFSIGLLSEDEQLFVIPFVMSAILGRCIQRAKRSPRCDCGVLGYSDRVSRLLPHVHNQRLFFVRAVKYPDSESVQEPQVHRGTWEGKRRGLISRSLFVEAEVTYPPRVEVLIMSLQVPPADWDKDGHMKPLVKCVKT